METKPLKNLKPGDIVIGITFVLSELEQRQQFVAHRKELKVIQIINETTLEMAADGNSETIKFDFKDDQLDKLYLGGKETYTGLFTDINNFQLALSELYKSKSDERLNKILDSFTERSVSDQKEVKNETEK